MILPHEHIFVDLGPIEEENWRTARAEDVIPVIAPEIEKIKRLGVTALVECTPEGVGRRADIDLAVSRATSFPVVLPTGIYREPRVPGWAAQASEDELTEWMVRELMEEIEGAGVPAAWIKVSAGDDGITDLETKILRAAARAGAGTGAIIGSHTIRGRVVRDQLAIIRAAGYTAERFIWIHTQAEPDTSLHTALAQEGIWLELDAIGSDRFGDDFFVDAVRRITDAGYAHRLLLSHDRGWFDPSRPGGGPVAPYTHMSEVFLPKLAAAGFDTAAIRQLTHTNPYNAYAR
jgi:phosphotriesterase-related protein